VALEDKNVLVSLALRIGLIGSFNSLSLALLNRDDRERFPDVLPEVGDVKRFFDM
jgi:hypothetical protein